MINDNHHPRINSMYVYIYIYMDIKSPYITFLVGCLGDFPMIFLFGVSGRDHPSIYKLDPFGDGKSLWTILGIPQSIGAAALVLDHERTANFLAVWQSSNGPNNVTGQWR